MGISVCLLVCMHTMYVFGACGDQRWDCGPWIGVTKGYMWPHECWEHNPDPSTRTASAPNFRAISPTPWYPIFSGKMIGDVCGVLCPGLSCSAHCRQADNTSRGLKRADDVEGGRHRGQMIPVVDNSQFPQFINYRNKKIFFGKFQTHSK